MTKKDLQERRFRRAAEDAQTAEQALVTPQTSDPAYKLAYRDTDFLLREELRPVRFQLELLKPESASCDGFAIARENVSALFRHGRCYSHNMLNRGQSVMVNGP